MIVKNAEVQWCFVKNVNEMSGKYQVEFFLNDEKSRNKLINELDNAWKESKGTYKGEPQSLGYTETDEGKIKFKATQAPTSADGKYTFEVGVYDGKGAKLTGDQIPNIGNGSTCNVDVLVYPYTFKSQKGVKLIFKNIQIVNLVEYEAGGNPGFGAVEGGYESGAVNWADDSDEADDVF